MIKTCARCGKEFDSYHGAKYCSDECRREVRNEEHRRYYHANIEESRAKALRRYHTRYPKKAPRIKACEKCGSEFEAKTNAKYCLKCRKIKNLEATRRYQAAHPEKVKAAQRRWALRNRARCNELQRSWREANRREEPARREDSREHEREYKRRYREANRERIREYDRQRYEQQRLKRERQRIIEKLFARRNRS